MRREFIEATITGAKEFTPIYQILERLRQIEQEYQPLLADSFWASDLAAWLHAYKWNADRLPAWLKRRLAEYFDSGGGTFIGLDFDDDFPENIRFPKIEFAAESLMKRGILQRSVFDQATEEIKAKSFTAAGYATDEAIERIRDLLKQFTLEGPSLDFVAAVEAKVGKSAIGPGHLENVYRTNIQAAYRDGREALIQDPIVGSVFPYQEYIPIEDGRTRPDHLALGELGLNGTGVYRRDDPFWDRFTPPWHYQCRCAVNLLTLEKAASKGVKEAQDWLRTGVPPESPEFRNDKIPFPHNPGWGQRKGVTV